jgi:phosphohistidine swiveling domain-containing protein
VISIGRLGLQAEDLTGSAQDVEWAIGQDGRIRVLQARAVTAAGEPERGGQIMWTRRFVGERWTEAASPCGWSIVGPLLEWFIDYPETSRRFLGGAPPTRLFRGWPYFNVSVFRHLAFKLPGRPPPRFMLEFLPPEESDHWMRRFAAPADLRVYASIFRTTFQEKRWRRFRANPFTNPAAWDVLDKRLDRDIPALARSEEPPVARVRAGIELARDYIKVHICSLLFANLTFQIAENLVPPDLKDDLLRCPSENWTQRTNRALYKLSQGADPKAFLARFGFRGAASSWEIFSPRWSEDPQRLERLVAPYANGVLADPEQVAAQQESAAREALEALSRRVWGPRGQALVSAVRLTRRYLQLREDQRYQFDRLLFVLKRALLDLGAEHFDDREDVRWLEWSEIQAMLGGEFRRDEALERIATRRRRWATYATEGRPPAFLVGDEALEIPVGGDRLRGLGISPGRVTGIVRILKSPDEAWKLGRGDILVATATDPGWTPLFLVAGGVVLELGSMLSHGAVIAREYRLPAVVNVPDATLVLRDGQQVTVDGTTGRIYAAKT